MSRLKQKFLTVLVILVGLFCVWLMRHNGTEDVSGTSKHSLEVHSDGASGDTAVETLRKLTSEIQASKAKTDDVRAALTAMEAVQESANFKSTQQLEAALVQHTRELKLRVDALESQTTTQHSTSDRANAAMTENNFLRNDTSRTIVPDISLHAEEGSSQIDNDSNRESFQRTLDAATDSELEFTPHAPSTSTAIPFATIPENATLLGATLMTGLIGRIPVQGKVTDPYPFKVLVGANNLASNGHRIPQLAGMVLSGIGTGDLGLSCARGEIHSLLFVFEDGSTVTVSSQKATHSAERGSGSLGWLSDTHGNPCLPGQLVTNAPRVLANSLAFHASQGLADLVSSPGANSAKSPKTALGASTLGKTYFGKLTKQASEEAELWWREHMKSSFDAVIVNAGTPVVIHMTQTIPLDNSELNRKLTYEDTHETPSSYRLD